MIKSRPVAFNQKEKSKSVAADTTAPFVTNTMKRFLVFILLLSLLIIGEYYFLTEVFTQKRIEVIAGSLALTILCLYLLIRFYKRSFISSRTKPS